MPCETCEQIEVVKSPLFLPFPLIPPKTSYFSDLDTLLHSEPPGYPVRKWEKGGGRGEVAE